MKTPSRNNFLSFTIYIFHSQEFFPEKSKHFRHFEPKYASACSCCVQKETFGFILFNLENAPFCVSKQTCGLIEIFVSLPPSVAFTY